jgi:hypothetical protein
MVAVNLFCNKQIAVSEAYRVNYDRVFPRQPVYVCFNSLCGWSCNQKPAGFPRCPKCSDILFIPTRSQ